MTPHFEQPSIVVPPRPARALPKQILIKRALRAARDIDPEFGVKIEPDGVIHIGRFHDENTKQRTPEKPVREFTL